jgi:hypothetical protein
METTDPISPTLEWLQLNTHTHTHTVRESNYNVDKLGI